MFLYLLSPVMEIVCPKDCKHITIFIIIIIVIMYIVPNKAKLGKGDLCSYNDATSGSPE